MEALIRIAKQVEIAEIQDARDIAEKLHKMHVTAFQPLLSPTHPGGPCEPPKLLHLDDAETKFLHKQLEDHRLKLLKMFKFYAGGDKDVNCREFLLFAKECGLRDLTISFSKCISVFIDSNVEEVDSFLSGDISSEQLADQLQMDFEEFIQAIKMLILRMSLDKRAKKEKAIQNFFNVVFRECPHYHLNLVEI